ncbi:MAG: hypothetical protein ACLGGX_09570, partial [Bdellovibrionia bacterium]
SSRQKVFLKMAMSVNSWMSASLQKRAIGGALACVASKGIWEQRLGVCNSQAGAASTELGGMLCGLLGLELFGALG